MIAPNVILIWTGVGGSVTGSKSNIPSGFVRETTLDGLFIKGTADTVDPDVTGGNPTHSHTSPAHAHTMVSHGHTVTTEYLGGSGDSDSGGTELTGYHYHHPSVTGLSGGALSSVASTYASLSNLPPYYSVILIKSTAYNFVPDDVIGLWANADLPLNFVNCDGTGGTINLGDKFLNGAATDTDAGATGGSTSNVHDLTHTHTESSHSHAQWINESGDVSGGGRRGSGTNGRARLVHYHYYALNANSAGSISTVQLTTAETVQPAYKKLECIQNTSGAGQLPPKGLIGLWLGTLATIPSGWFLCDGNNGTPDMRGMFLKAAINWGQIGDTGGSNTHTHAAQGHVHTGGSHTHTNAATASSHLKHNLNGTTGANGVGGSWETLDKNNYHNNYTTIGSTAASWASTDTTADNSNNEPEYRTVAYIQFQYGAGGSILSLIV